MSAWETRLRAWLGEDLRVDAREVAGCALACGGLIHATAVPRV